MHPGPAVSAVEGTDQLSLGVDPLADVLAWRQENEAAWRQIVKWAHEDRAAAIAPSTRAYAYFLRRPHFVRRLRLTRMLGDQVLINDHITSGLSRLLNREFPALKVPTREAAVDSWPTS